MLVTAVPADAFGTNCYVVATGPGEQCVVVDPGIGVADRLEEVFAEHRLHPAAVLLTHGHVDHTFSVAPVCGARGIPAYIHPADADLLADPARPFGTTLDALFGGRLRYTEPDDVAELTDGEALVLAGLEITVDHAPGHTGGSVMFRLPAAGSPWEAEQLCLSGDVLFAGSIGRTDLGGDDAAMQATLRDKVLPLADDTVVLPGHGPETTIGRERAANPFLRGLQSAPHRGL
ncbi:MBL fold metallo-hydrolase [Spirilliplanes yamanashiensis]|uniref:Hydrolase n=1 Tax=Spirilliplanes yamanashiensis TaxID=42233 RepID=A0A8J3YC90_9ACTN|nr:MBL fold metallo-hydrolase [Spirilliplanes yamanashiensis]MDP9818661.1 glyoxylase-like metal-dependent hydrolase (beta-lactamase superfamily II) [Spirilliplanes yamanashiensis]GIJ05117.1 hydrolase [Spirilliplanes yamanashiensis]